MKKKEKKKGKKKEKKKENEHKGNQRPESTSTLKTSKNIWGIFRHHSDHFDHVGNLLLSEVNMER